MLSSPTINSNDNKFNFCCARDSSEAAIEPGGGAAVATGIVEGSEGDKAKLKRYTRTPKTITSRV